jgi:hypothetical protein
MVFNPLHFYFHENYTNWFSKLDNKMEIASTGLKQGNKVEIQAGTLSRKKLIIFCELQKMFLTKTRKIS